MCNLKDQQRKELLAELEIAMKANQDISVISLIYKAADFKFASRVTYDVKFKLTDSDILSSLRYFNKHK